MCTPIDSRATYTSYVEYIHKYRQCLYSKEFVSVFVCAMRLRLHTVEKFMIYGALSICGDGWGGADKSKYLDWTICISNANIAISYSNSITEIFRICYYFPNRVIY